MTDIEYIKPDLSVLGIDKEAIFEYGAMISRCHDKIDENEKNKNKSDTIISTLCEYSDCVNWKMPNLIKELNKLYNKCHYILFENDNEENEDIYICPHGILELSNELIKNYSHCNFGVCSKEHKITGKFEDYIVNLYGNEYKNIILCNIPIDKFYKKVFNDIKYFDAYDEINKLTDRIPKYELKKLK